MIAVESYLLRACRLVRMLSLSEVDADCSRKKSTSRMSLTVSRPASELRSASTLGGVSDQTWSENFDISMFWIEEVSFGSTEKPSWTHQHVHDG